MRLKNLFILTLAAVATSAPTWADTPGGAVNTSLYSASSANAIDTSSKKTGVTYEMNVLKLNGTVMVEHADKTKPTALQTGSVVEKGDVITVYDDSWAVFKTRRGDKIGLDGDTLITIDEFYMEGPDRQIRLLVQRGTLFLQTNGDNSRQSFFEINMGNVVASINNLQAIMSYNPSKSFVDVKYIRGKINIIDQNREETFTIHQGEYNADTKSEADYGDHSGTPQEHMEHTWVNGKMAEEEPIPLEELDEINFRKFFDGEKRIIPDENNMLMDDSNFVPYRQR
jgi:hypothetical protein